MRRRKAPFRERPDPVAKLLLQGHAMAPDTPAHLLARPEPVRIRRTQTEARAKKYQTVGYRMGSVVTLIRTVASRTIRSRLPTSRSKLPSARLRRRRTIARNPPRTRR